MLTRHVVPAFAFAFAMLGAAQAGGDHLQPAQAYRIDLGKVSGVAYYTVERDGFYVVTTLAQGEDGTPVRVVSVLAPGQSVVVSTPSEAGRAPTAVEIRRQSDTLLVREIAEVMN
jgi:hypothetical protein